MKNIRFKKLLLLSYHERTARTINLDSDLIVVKGPNRIGKSCILKSLYAALGGKIKKEPTEWKDARAVIVLYFTIDGALFKSIKYGDILYMFNPDNSIRYKENFGSDKANTKFSELLGVKLGTTENPIVFSQSSLFMPFYIDQDDGWEESWSSFAGIKTSEKAEVRLILLGLIDRDYFSKKKEQMKVEDVLKKTRNELKAYKKLFVELKGENKECYIPVDLGSFKKEINEFLENLKKLRESQKDILRKLQALYTKKTYYEVSINQLNENIKQIQKDFDFALEIDDDIVTCPTCGAQYSNNMLNRHVILEDEHTCKDLLIQYSDKLNHVKKNIEKYEEDNVRINERIAEVQKNLKASNDNISLGEVIDSKSNYKMINNLSSKIKKLEEDESSTTFQQLSLKESIKGYESNGRKEDAEKVFKKQVISNLKELSIDNYNSDNIRLGGRIGVTGSDLPLFHVAYTFAYYSLMVRYNGLLMFPIVIDELRQQGLEDEGLHHTISFITKHIPNRGQLIIALADDNIDIPTDSKVFQFQNGDRILTKDQYVEVRDEIEELLNKDFCNRPQ